MNMATGKHDRPAPLPEALESHYKDRLKTLEYQLDTATSKLKDAMMHLDRKDIQLAEKDAYIEELRSALVEMTVKATMGGVK